MEYVLPRIKTKRKRRRPPSPYELFAMFYVLMSLIMIAICVWRWMKSHDEDFMWNIVCPLGIAESSYFIHLWWPLAIHYFKDKDE